MNDSTYGSHAVQVTSRTSGKTWTIQPGQDADLRRDPAAVIALEHEKTSRTAHARIEWSGGKPVLAKVGETRSGIFQMGAPKRRVPINGRTLVRLGAADAGEDLEFTLVPATAPPPGTAHQPPPTDGAGGVAGGGVAGGVAVGPDGLPVQDIVNRRAGGRPSGGATGPDGQTPATAGGGPMDDNTGTVSVSSAGLTGPTLTVSAGSDTKALPGEPGRVYTLGRSADSDMHLKDGGVSRDHLRIFWDSSTWVVTDVSSRGTYRTTKGNAQLPPGVPVPFSETLALRLGNATSGEYVTLDIPGTAAAPKVPTWLVPAAAAALVLSIIGSVFALTRGEDDTDGDPERGNLTSAELDTVKKSVVRLAMYDKDDEPMGTGSGSIISKDGLILTNSHVASPQADGMKAQYGWDFPSDPVDYLIVGITEKPDTPVKELYRAKLLASDGLADLAVVKIYANADGSGLEGSPDLPALPIADSDKVKSGDDLTILGFPDGGDDDSLTVTKGGASSSVADPHLNTDRGWFDSSATIRHGNSGGTGVNDEGELIGVPTRLWEGELQDKSQRLRPINIAKPIIEAAKAGEKYTSPYLVEPSGQEQATFLGLSPEGCAGDPDKWVPAVDSGTTSFAANFGVSGEKNLDVFPAIAVIEEGTPQIVTSTNEFLTGEEEVECFSVPVSGEIPDGQYQAVLLAGPNGDEVLTSGTFGVGVQPQSVPAPGSAP